MLLLLGDPKTLLQANGYSVLVEEDSRVLYFEDLSVAGRVEFLSTAQEIVSKWQSIQDSFLASRAQRLVRDSEKGWNIYTVLLTTEEADEATTSQLLQIEENFHATRKIARSCVKTAIDVSRALAPLLRLPQVDIRLGANDAEARLRESLTAIHPLLAGLLKSEPQPQLATRLVEES